MEEKMWKMYGGKCTSLNLKRKKNRHKAGDLVRISKTKKTLKRGMAQLDQRDLQDLEGI